MEQTKKTEAKKPLGTYEKQKRTTIVLLIVAVVLAVCAVVAYYFVNLDKSSFEQGGVRYRVQMKDGEYVLTNAEGYTCEKTSDGYYVTDDGMLMVAVKEDGTYAFYAAVEGLEDGEEVYNRVAQTILIFPYVSRDNLQALTVHNEHGSYTVYRDESGGFRNARSRNRRQKREIDRNDVRRRYDRAEITAISERAASVGVRRPWKVE